MNVGLFGWLAVGAFAAVLVFAAAASVFVRRLLLRPSTPAGEQIGGVGAVLAKVRKHEPMSRAEADFAAQIIKDRSSPMAFSVPASLFAVGCLYVFGSLEQLHGASPSWGTFIGVLPMLGAVNMGAQLMRIGHLKRGLGGEPMSASRGSDT